MSRWLIPMLTIVGLFSTTYAQKRPMNMEEFLAQQPRIRIIKANGVNQPQGLSQGYCEFPRESASGGLAGNVEAQSPAGAVFRGGFFIPGEVVSLPLKDGVLKERTLVTIEQTMDTATWRYENGQLIGESVYFLANRNVGTFRRVMIATDREMKQFHEIRYETGDLKDRSVDPAIVKEIRDIVICTASMY